MYTVSDEGHPRPNERQKRSIVSEVEFVIRREMVGRCRCSQTLRSSFSEKPKVLTLLMLDRTRHVLKSSTVPSFKLQRSNPGMPIVVPTGVDVGLAGYTAAIQALYTHSNLSDGRRGHRDGYAYAAEAVIVKRETGVADAVLAQLPIVTAVSGVHYARGRMKRPLPARRFDLCEYGHMRVVGKDGIR